jgi:hypothetical protein
MIGLNELKVLEVLYSPLLAGNYRSSVLLLTGWTRRSKMQEAER